MSSDTTSDSFFDIGNVSLVDNTFTELTLRTLEQRTPLVRCHRQYLVNMAHLKEIRLEDNGQAELLLRDGLKVPVSRRYLKNLKEALGL